MELLCLKIEKVLYGTDKGKLIANINIGDEKGSIRMDLSPDVSARLVRVAVDEIDRATAVACDDFRQRLIQSIAHVPMTLPPPLPIEV